MFTDMFTVSKIMAGTQQVSININGKNEENHTKVSILLLMDTRGRCRVTEWTGRSSPQFLPQRILSMQSPGWESTGQWPHRPIWDMEMLLLPPKAFCQTPSQATPGEQLQSTSNELWKEMHLGESIPANPQQDLVDTSSWGKLRGRNGVGLVQVDTDQSRNQSEWGSHSEFKSRNQISKNTRGVW